MLDFCRKFVTTTKVPETKGCVRCSVGRNPYNGYKYLCGAMPNSVFLMQWYEPLNKFMLLKVRMGKGTFRSLPVILEHNCIG